MCTPWWRNPRTAESVPRSPAGGCILSRHRQRGDHSDIPSPTAVSKCGRTDVDPDTIATQVTQHLPIGQKSMRTQYGSTTARLSSSRVLCHRLRQATEQQPTRPTHSPHHTSTPGRTRTCNPWFRRPDAESSNASSTNELGQDAILSSASEQCAGDTDCHPMAPGIDAATSAIQYVADAWPSLPPHIREAIITLVRIYKMKSREGHLNFESRCRFP